MKWKFTLLILFILLFSACSNQEANSPENTASPDLQRVNDPTNHQTTQEHTNQEAAERLVQLANSVQNVNNARAVVFGDYTIIGIDIDEDLDRGKSGSVKHAVTEIIKHDPYGHYAYVMADGDIMKRIANINESIQNGQGRSVILDEIANVIGRYIPDMPMRETDQDEQYEKNQENTDDIQQERQEQNQPL